MPNTYVALATQTLSSAASTVTFTSIPATYTDLFVIISCPGTTTGGDWVMSVNNDSGTNYSRTYLYGTGSAAGSGRSTSTTAFALGGGRTDGYCKINIMNYSNTTTYKTVLWNIGSAGTDIAPMVGLWRSTAAINRIDFINATYPVGSTFSLYGIAANNWAAQATGGTITRDVAYTYHTFTSSGTFTPNQPLTADVLVLAGGGGGGGEFGGGGGGGGLLFTPNLSLIATGYSASVGAGGTGAISSQPGNGNNSVFSSYTAIGGGSGGANSNTYAARTGGSGGGGSRGGSGAAGTSGQGFAGGNAVDTQGAGGGGAGAVGVNGVTTSVGSAGGAGSNTYASWAIATSTGSGNYYGGGGGGAGYAGVSGAGGAGGIGGGGSGGGTSSGAAAGGAGGASTGGGGGGGSYIGGVGNYTGGNGGSGLVIIRYPNL